jgi:hypothetical protein
MTRPAPPARKCREAPPLSGFFSSRGKSTDGRYDLSTQAVDKDVHNGYPLG